MAEIELCLNFSLNDISREIKHRLSPDLKEFLSNRIPTFNKENIEDILENAKLDVVETIFFHSCDLNQELYHYAWENY